MKRLLSAAFALLVSACATTARALESEAPIETGITHRLHSQVLGDDREINVWTPPGYAAGDARHTVLYLLDGALDQDFGHIAGLRHLGALSATYDTLIIVGVQTRTRIRELTPPPSDPRYVSAFPQAGGSAQFRRFLREEVIPYVEARYRVSPRRALIGESLAGLFVMDTLLNEPALFSDYIAVSPSLWWDDRALARQAPLLLNAHEASDRRLYLSIADESGAMRDGVKRMRTALDAAPERVTLRFVDRAPGETHATTFHPAALDALRWLYATPPYDYGPTPWWLTEGASPPAN